jgi:hypothetical protein
MSDFYTAREIEESQEDRRVYEVFNEILSPKDDGRYRTCLEVSLCSFPLTMFPALFCRLYSRIVCRCLVISCLLTLHTRLYTSAPALDTDVIHIHNQLLFALAFDVVLREHILSAGFFVSLQYQFSRSAHCGVNMNPSANLLVFSTHIH